MAAALSSARRAVLSAQNDVSHLGNVASQGTLAGLSARPQRCSRIRCRREICNDKRYREPITLCLTLACNDCGHRRDHLPFPLTRKGRQSPFPDCLTIKAAARNRSGSPPCLMLQGSRHRPESVARSYSCPRVRLAVRTRVSGTLMGYVAQGIKSFKKGLADSDDESRRKC